MSQSNFLVLLDSGPVGRIIHPNLKKDSNKRTKIQNLITFIGGIGELKIPGCIDYEIRRELLLNNFNNSVTKLDRLRENGQLLAITQKDFDIASYLWSWARQAGYSLGDHNRIEIDSILAAQAISQKEKYDQVLVLTSNAKHLQLYSQFGFYVWEWEQALKDAERRKAINPFDPVTMGKNVEQAIKQIEDIMSEDKTDF